MLKQLSILAGAVASSTAFGSIISISSGSAVLGNRAANLVMNGRFETREDPANRLLR